MSTPEERRQEAADELANQLWPHLADIGPDFPVAEIPAGLAYQIHGFLQGVAAGLAKS